MVLTHFHDVSTNPIAIDLKIKISYEWVVFKVCNVYLIGHANEYPTMQSSGIPRQALLSQL